MTAAREPQRFAHVAQRARNDLQDRQLLAAKTAELAEAGVTVLDDPHTTPGASALTWLRPSPADPEGAELTAENHMHCPGRAAHLRVSRPWNSDHEPQVTVTWWCLDPTGNGHAALRDDRPLPQTGAGDPSTAPAESDAEKEVRRVERRRVIENNKAWDASVPVRRAWLRELLARKTAPKDAARYIAAALATGGYELSRAIDAHNALACDLLGLSAPAGHGRPSPMLPMLETAGAAKATQVMLAIVLAAQEDALGRHSWRDGHTDGRAATYMAALKQWGYPAEPVEDLVIDPNADGHLDTPDTDGLADDHVDADRTEHPVDEPDADDGSDDGSDDGTGETPCRTRASRPAEPRDAP
ncbi:MAG: hypothetical protein ABS81_08160 [Pseudonocardia sp. SCN 72-86]|nr:MAG: hypothetical protein ABS81_08160 [Pseudonocardia sp. SCN 72-86]